jgi:hypothetical protein
MIAHGEHEAFGDNGVLPQMTTVVNRWDEKAGLRRDAVTATCGAGL